jgi:hypothetical protein
VGGIGEHVAVEARTRQWASAADRGCRVVEGQQLARCGGDGREVVDAVGLHAHEDGPFDGRHEHAADSIAS